MILFFVFNRFFRILVFVQLVPRLFLAAAEDDVEDGFEEHESKSHVPDFSPVCHGWLKWERSKSAGWTCEPNSQKRRIHKTSTRNKCCKNGAF